MDWIIGAVCASMVAGAAYAKKSLTLSGCLAAIMMGTIYYGAGNLFWFGTLLLFFITSTLLSRFRKDRKQEPGEILCQVRKSGCRTSDG